MGWWLADLLTDDGDRAGELPAIAVGMLDAEAAEAQLDPRFGEVFAADPARESAAAEVITGFSTL